jgi:UDPglucose 6-dehydrogenase
MIVTDPASAETIKYASNAFLATKVSFANAIANLCEAVGADVRDVVLGMGYDKRIGFEFLRPGPGWGGSCFPKDTRALIRIAEDAGYELSLLRGVIELNEKQYERIAEKIIRAAGGSVDGVRIAALGLTFKARTDDMRDSPAIQVLRRLLARGAIVRAFDPAIDRKRELDLDIEVCDDAYAACEGARVVTVLTEWDDFRRIDYRKVGELVEQRTIVDARNLLDPPALRRWGFTYEGVGRAGR